ncbi:MAG: hypothetical protein JW819_02670 [Candidatus Krumholzibacteriota bacterium]|nr:hypothetical protein [Candidatus Krumholzibacteriota bacterium]
MTDGVAQAAGSCAGEVIEWRVFLLTRHPGRGLFAALVIALTAWFTWSVSASAWLTGLAAFILLGSLSSFFFPTRYRLDGETLRASNLFWRRTRRWEEFRAMRHQGRQLKLLTLPGDSRLDNFRGMLLLLPEDREPVLEFARRRLGVEADERT